MCSVKARFRLVQGALIAWLLGSMLLLSACGGSAQVQQQTSQRQSNFDRLLLHAQQIGVPGTLLQPIVKQEDQLKSTSAPLSLFSDQPANNYYQNLSARYAQLEVQLQGLITSSTQQTQAQAQHDLQGLQLALTQFRSQGLPVQSFTQQYNQFQKTLGKAQYPRDYIAVSNQAHTARQALDLMQISSENMTTFKHTVDQLQQAHVDVTALMGQYQSDQDMLKQATQPRDFQQLEALINAQYQQAAVNTTQAIPFITTARLNDLNQQMQLLQKYGVDTSSYQKKLDADRAMLSQTTDMQAYERFSNQINADISSMHNDMVRGEAKYLVQQFHQQASSWGDAHKYHDTFDGNNYPLDAGYLSQGIGSDLDAQLSAAVTTQDYQDVVDQGSNNLFNLQMLEQDYQDHTPYTQAHNTDMQLLAHYSLQQGQVIVVSFVEQSLRLYQDGKLVRSFLVTTGRTALPALPGSWNVLVRLSPTVFKSPDPPGSPYWYPDTPIHYAMEYHYGGYFVHDSWWRVNYGPGTQFPHYDSGGDESFAGDGSHGCVNMQEDQAAWMFNNTNYNTRIVIY